VEGFVDGVGFCEIDENEGVKRVVFKRTITPRGNNTNCVKRGGGNEVWVGEGGNVKVLDVGISSPFEITQTSIAESQSVSGPRSSIYLPYPPTLVTTGRNMISLHKTNLGNEDSPLSSRVDVSITGDVGLGVDR